MNSILIVDSDGKALAATQRRLRGAFKTHIALGPQVGLQCVREEGPFALVMAEFAMPEMDGVDFLARVRELAPWTTRVLLSRVPMDVADMLRVVNEAKVFHLLSSSCSETTLHTIATEGVDRFKRIVVANQDMNDSMSLFAVTAHEIVCSLRGSLRDVLSPVLPLLRGLCLALEETCPVITETAFLLSSLGLAALPPELLARMTKGRPLEPAERATFAAHPEYAVTMIRNLPQLIQASSILSGYAQLLRGEEGKNHAGLPTSSVLLALTMECRLAMFEGLDPAAIVGRVKGNALFTLPMIRALEAGLAGIDQREVEVQTDRLRPGMVLARAAVGRRDGQEVVLIVQGYELTRTTIAVLRQAERQGQLRGPVMVRAGSVIPPAGSESV